MSKLHGYQWLSSFNIHDKFRKGLNVYVKFYYMTSHKKDLKESKLFIIDKSLLTTNMSMSEKDKILKDSYNKILMKEIFPHTIMDTFYYTDNRTKIPKEFIVEEVEKNPQLTFSF